MSKYENTNGFFMVVCLRVIQSFNDTGTKIRNNCETTKEKEEKIPVSQGIGT
jgi:hypothetical protein